MKIKNHEHLISGPMQGFHENSVPRKILAIHRSYRGHTVHVKNVDTVYV